MTYSRPEFYANTTLLSPDSCSKHCISMYLYEYPTKHWFSAKKLSPKIRPTPKP